MAKQQNIISCLQQMNYPLKQEGHYFRSEQHSSLVINGQNGKWTWNSRDLAGSSPVSLLTYILENDYGYELKEAYITAIKRLAGTENQTDDKLIFKPETDSNNFKIKPKGDFVLPKKNDNCNRGISYLCKSRGLDREIVLGLIKEGKIYETATYHNVCFVSYDENNIPKHGSQRGTITNTNKAFKGDVENSDKAYGFVLKGNEEAKRVCIFESSIDCISHATLYKLNNIDYKDVHRVGLHGTSFLALNTFLEQNPQVTEIVDCLDNDITGRRRGEKMCLEYAEKGYKTFQQPSIAKDYNEELIKFQRENANEILQEMEP